MTTVPLEKNNAPGTGGLGAGVEPRASSSDTHYTPNSSHAQASKLLAHLHRGGTWAYWWTNPGKRSTWWPVGEPPPVPGGKVNVYFGVHPARQRKGTNERTTIADVAVINCLFAEVDAKDYQGGKADALDHVNALDPPPSVVVDSGGGYHCYWLLAEPYTLTTDTKRERARMIQRRWVEFAGGDPGAKDLARVLRVPGTVNYKPEYGPSFPTVTVIRAGFDRLYDLDDLEALLSTEDETRSETKRSAPRDNGRSSWAEAALAEELATLARATQGTRNDTLNRTAFALGQIVGAGLLDQVDVERALVATALGIGLGEREALATIRSGMDAGKLEPREPKDDSPANTPTKTTAGDYPQEQRYHLTDLGNARRLVARHGDGLRYSHPWKRWLVWDGKRWGQDDTGQVMRRAKDTVAHIYAEATSIPDEDGRKAVAKHAMGSERATRLREMVDLAKSEPGIPVLPDMLDRDPWRLNVLNGTLDLRTGELKPHEPKDHLTKLAPVSYDSAALCPLWLDFLDRIMAGNAEVIRFLQRAVGYSLTGDVSEDCFFICYGTGANGKTTFSRTLSGMLGDYALQTPVETLMIRRRGTIPNDVARLQGARFVTAAEAEEGQRLAESLVKQMTGKDKIAARFLNAEWFDFPPTFKIWLGTNHKPAIRGTDYAIWRRIRLIPFSVTIPEAEQDRALVTKLLGEIDGVLAWAVQGCLEWQRDGLGTPAEVTQATQAYRNEMDVLGTFLEECCIMAENVRARGGELYKAYQEWCKESGEDPMTGTMFGRRLTERGFDKIKTRHVYYLGLGLSADQEEGEIPL